MSNTAKRLHRSRTNKWFGGVCGGLADYSGMDASLIRIIVVVATIFGAGSLFLVYVIAWVLVPREGSTSRIFGDRSTPTS